MRKLAVSFPVLLLFLLNSCKKEETFISPECQNPVIYDKFDNARELVLGVLDARLANYATTGHCDTCYNAELIQANQEVYSIGELYDQTGSCCNVYHSYQGYCYKMITGSQFISSQTDSAELVTQRQNYHVKFEQILRYVESLQSQ
jgi:hypothetical protein